MTFFERHKIRRVVNALGTSTIVGANTAPPEVIAAATEALATNCEIGEPILFDHCQNVFPVEFTLDAHSCIKSWRGIGPAAT